MELNIGLLESLLGESRFTTTVPFTKFLSFWFSLVLYLALGNPAPWVGALAIGAEKFVLSKQVVLRCIFPVLPCGQPCHWHHDATIFQLWVSILDLRKACFHGGRLLPVSVSLPTWDDCHSRRTESQMDFSLHVVSIE